MSALKHISLMVAISGLFVFVWMLVEPEKQAVMVASDIAAPGGMIKAQGFHYTEYIAGIAAYQLSGEEIHDEHARFGSMRISAIKVVFVRRPQLHILVGAGKGWLLSAAEGKIISNRKRLILTGDVRGTNSQGGSLRSNKAVVNMSLGAIELKDGYEINTRQRHERGILTAL